MTHFKTRLAIKRGAGRSTVALASILLAASVLGGCDHLAGSDGSRRC